MVKITLVITIGRRVPRSWLKRTAHKAAGLITFQENIWIMINQSFNMAKKKATAAGDIKFITQKEEEIEDINYQIEWLKIIIQGSKEQEEYEYASAMKLYAPFNKVLKGNIPKDDRMASHFKTKILSSEEVEDAYKKGYGALGNESMGNKLLEMGILTTVKKIDDFENRTMEL